MMSLYALKNDSGELIDATGTTEETCIEKGTFFQALATKPEKLDVASKDGVKAVELIEKPGQVLVSGQDGQLLDNLDSEITHGDTSDDANVWMSMLIERGWTYKSIYSALATGWKVEEPKRWNVKVPHTTDELYWKRGNGNIGCVGAWQNDDEIVRNRAFTLAEIEHYGLQDCEKVEVSDNAN
jgi:hypothetical protein